MVSLSPHTDVQRNLSKSDLITRQPNNALEPSAPIARRRRGSARIVRLTDRRTLEKITKDKKTESEIVALLQRS